jgi:hypothetical protein
MFAPQCEHGGPAQGNGSTFIGDANPPVGDNDLAVACAPRPRSAKRSPFRDYVGEGSELEANGSKDLRMCGILTRGGSDELPFQRRRKITSFP